MAGIAFLFMAAFLYIVVPEGRVVFVVQRKPTFSKRDIVAIGLALEAPAGSWWEEAGGFVLLALVVVVLTVSLGPAHRRR